MQQVQTISGEVLMIEQENLETDSTHIDTDERQDVNDDKRDSSNNKQDDENVDMNNDDDDDKQDDINDNKPSFDGEKVDDGDDSVTVKKMRVEVDVETVAENLNIDKKENTDIVHGKTEKIATKELECDINVLSQCSNVGGESLINDENSSQKENMSQEDCSMSSEVNKISAISVSENNSEVDMDENEMAEAMLRYQSERKLRRKRLNPRPNIPYRRNMSSVNVQSPKK